MFNMINGFLKSISEINKKYRTPTIQITPWVKVSLFILRMYLLILVGLLVFRFITLLHK
ncbi:MAG: hypothetical protein ABSG94_04030 [Brevinematales bacterium]|jgi:hypothetical protein